MKLSQVVVNLTPDTGTDQMDTGHWILRHPDTGHPVTQIPGYRAREPPGTQVLARRTLGYRSRVILGHPDTQVPDDQTRK